MSDRIRTQVSSVPTHTAHTAPLPPLVDGAEGAEGAEGVEGAEGAEGEGTGTENYVALGNTNTGNAGRGDGGGAGGAGDAEKGDAAQDAYSSFFDDTLDFCLSHDLFNSQETATLICCCRLPLYPKVSPFSLKCDLNPPPPKNVHLTPTIPITPLHVH
ncbi:hypothetical protein B484DRAFT_110411 [Ochromonadaceae sp. CCMP2298]|nr:hypothetical protein B484DRAFT_110411 [Ochromonadaceae sp. CCMP2298]